MKLADMPAAATVTDAGTERSVLVLLTLTAAPPAGAGWVRVTVQALDEFGPRVVGIQARAETITGATRLMVALAELAL